MSTKGNKKTIYQLVLLDVDEELDEAISKARPNRRAET